MICRRCSKTAPDGLYCVFCGAKQDVPRNVKKRGNGTGTAFKRGKTWTAQVTRYTTVEDGKYVRKYATKGGFATKRDALSYIAQLRSANIRKVPTLLDLWQVYEENDLPKLSKDKQTAYKKARQRLEPIIGRKVDALTTADLQACVNENSNSYYTARDMKSLLSHLYRRAGADQFVPANLSRYIVLPDLEEKEPEPFTEEEVDRMWTAYANGDTFVGYLLLMIYSGMMPAELFACQTSMIDLEKCEIYGCGKKTKTRKNNSIVFADVVRPVVEELMSEGEYLCPWKKNDWYEEYHRAVQRVGVRDLPPYSCRHTTGTEAARKNLSASIIQQIMRHAKITTSQRYIHLGTGEAHDGINKLMTNA